MTTAAAEFMPAIEKAALDAGRAIMAIYDQGALVREKADLSPVTDADEAAERIILAGLRDLAPDIPVVAEESMAAGVGPVDAGPRFWLVDPLDGTKEFIRRRGEFTVNIGLIENGAPVLGVVYAPALGRLYAGATGGGAWRVDTRDHQPLERTAIAVRQADGHALVAVASKSHRTPETDAFLGRLSLATSRAAGSSLKFCLLAEGEADIYPRFGPTMEWDTAAGHAVLLAAGGVMTNLDGTAFRYGKPDYRNPGFLACGRLPEGLLSR